MTVAKQDFDQLMNQARVKLPGASDAGIKGELFDALHEFLDLSSVWTETISVSVLPGTTMYSLVPDSGQIIRLAGVVDGNNVSQPALLNDTFDGLQFANPYNKAQTMLATVVKSVVLPTSREQIPVLPREVFPRWHNYILDGLLGRMMGQLNKSYSNEALSTYHLRRFLNGAAQARVAKLQRHTVGAQSWQFPRAFSSGSQRGGVSVGSDIGFKVD